MKHWYVCTADGILLDVFQGATALDVVKAYCYYWNEPATPDSWNRYRAVKDLTDSYIKDYGWKSFVPF